MSTANLRLRPELSFSPVRTNGSVSYVVEDRSQQCFWRIGALEYEVCAAIDGRLSTQQVLNYLRQNSSLASEAGPEKIQKVLIWLLHSGLADECARDTGSQVDKPKPVSAVKPVKLFDPSSFKIPIFSSAALEFYTHYLTWLVSIPCLILAVLAWGTAIVMVFQNNQDLMSLGRKLFVPGSQWWWLLAWAILKAVHEAGHAIACVRVGAKSKGAGIGFMFLAPMPYVDVTNLWRVENKWARALVSAAGMLFELTLASLAIICACFVENSSIRYLCFSIATLGTFTTIAFNGNPLMRFDGYYIFVDLIGRPNLWQDAARTMKSLFSTWLTKDSGNQNWSFLLLSYGIASWISRMLVLVTMGWGLWMTWDGIGLMVVGFFVCLWFVIPPIMRMRVSSKQINHTKLLRSIRSVCLRKVVRCIALVSILVLCSFLPSPLQFYWPAIVDYVDPSDIRTVAAGFVEEVFVHDGQGVRAGDIVLRLSNPALELEYRAAESLMKTSEEKCANLRTQRKHSELQAEEAIYESLVFKCNSLRSNLDTLIMKAPRDGVMLARMSHNLNGSFIPEGQSIGIIVDPTQIEVLASVPQYAWETVAHNVNAPVSIHMFNGQQWFGKVLTTLPRTSDKLDSPSLGGRYGGPISVVLSKDAKGEDQLKTDSPRLQTRIELDREHTDGQAKLPPPPGALCSVKLTGQHEAIWQTGYRWLTAAIQVHFDRRN